MEWTALHRGHVYAGLQDVTDKEIISFYLLTKTSPFSFKTTMLSSLVSPSTVVFKRTYTWDPNSTPLIDSMHCCVFPYEFQETRLRVGRFGVGSGLVRASGSVQSTPAALHWQLLNNK
jgi:hypothetical protein